MNAPVTKTILVLANSIKKYPDRCIAGIGIEVTEGGSQFGQWIRLTDPSQPEGAVPVARTWLKNWVPVRPLQLIQAVFDGPANDANHPEDWNLHADSKMVHLADWDRSVLDGIQDQSGDLWGRESAATRSVAAGTAGTTLKIVKPSHPVLVEAFKEYDSFKGKNRLRKILTIWHDELEHKFNITDPLFDHRHGISPSQIAEDEPLKFTLNPAGLAIVVSLTPPLKGRQYKIAAAILEP